MFFYLGKEAIDKFCDRYLPFLKYFDNPKVDLNQELTQERYDRLMLLIENHKKSKLIFYQNEFFLVLFFHLNKVFLRQ